ncbi:hypothetical protein [Metabacillus fastidiosus]|uniref:hypothetical protein n=1 Tax=Metabacillus fastidiosus TaxID=1458 RepID=UPI003D26BDC2
MIFLIVILLGLIIGFLYARYFPVWGVPCMNEPSSSINCLTVVDVRDYTQSYKDSDHESVHIPVGYLKRYFYEIPGGEVHIIASDSLERNISIRFFRRRGFNVTGYTLTDCACG